MVKEGTDANILLVLLVGVLPVYVIRNMVGATRNPVSEESFREFAQVLINTAQSLETLKVSYVVNRVRAYILR